MRLARRMRQEADAGLSPSLLSTLHSVARLEPVTLGDLARAERVRPSSTSVIVTSLERDGLVRRQTNRADRRLVQIRLTSEGRRAVERSRSRKTAYLARRVRSLDREARADLARAADVLERLLELDAHGPAHAPERAR
jgi:DNA-binding MarR family transcriptional regulator